MLKIMLQHDFCTAFPNIYILLHFYLKFQCLTAQENEASAIWRGSNVFHSSVAQERMSNLALLNIEEDNVQKMNFTDIIDLFTDAKTRKTVLNILF